MNRILTVIALFTLAAGAFAADTVWTRRYDGPAGGDEVARAVLTDRDGNVFVVGTSPGVATGNDFVVIKYTPAGTIAWTTRIAGPGGSNDDARAAVLGPDGAVYVTGTTGFYPDYNYLTVKINSDSTEAWRAIYEGPGGKPDYAVATAVDPAGCTYVTGHVSDSSGTLTDYLTVKYNQDGSQAWAARYDGGGNDYASAVALGEDGSVYVTGSSRQGSTEDYLTVKYDANGEEKWVQTYNGPGNGNDAAAALAVDASGNVYVTGSSGHAPPPGGISDYATIKYGPSGDRLWAKRYTGRGYADEPASLVLGGSALYVTGKSSSGSNYDYATIAYDLVTGDTHWVRRFNGPAGKDDVAVGIALDSAGRIHVLGTSMGANNRADYCRLRYSAGGALEGAARYNSPYDNDDQAVGIAVDAGSRVVVTGTSFGGSGMMTYDIQTVKYDSAIGMFESHRSPVSKAGLRIWPNPAGNWAAFSSRLAADGPVSFALHDASGRSVPIRVKPLSASSVFRLDMTRLPAGVYVLSVRSSATIESVKFVRR